MKPAENNAEQLDITKYAYAPESELKVSGNFFMSVKNILEKFLVKETLALYREKPTPEEFYGQNADVCLTGLGMEINSLMGILMLEHESNVEAGNATLIEELNRAKLNLVS